MTITARIVSITIPERALNAADKLVSALHDLNAADRPYAVSGDAAPYGMVERALTRTLAGMTDESPAETYALVGCVYTAYLDGCEDSVQDIIQGWLGWDLTTVESGVTNKPANTYSPRLEDTELTKYAEIGSQYVLEVLPDCK